MHTSIKLDNPIEMLDITPINPLISKCQIKVCYVGDTPNRNGSVITKEVAKQMANSIPGSPIVGFYNEAEGDFEEHNRIIDVSNGQFNIKDTTRPYGFVSMDAKVWFDKYSDDGVEHEYLVTEGYLWTGQYPECNRVINNGNNQSMELADNYVDATWTKDDNGKPQFFIINEAVISKLCILGENVEPCFEGSQINKLEFAFDEGFKTELFNFMKLMEENLKEGGAPVFTKYSVTVGDALWTSLYSNIDNEKYAIDGVFEDGDQKFAVLQNREDNTFSRMNFSFVDDVLTVEELVSIEDYVQSEEPQFALADVEAFEVEFKKKKDEKEDEKSEDDSGEKKDEPDDKKDDKESKDDDMSDDKSDDEDSKDKKKKKKYNLEEVEEYTELKAQHDELTTNYANATARIAELESQMAELSQFKNSVDRKAKEDLINNEFCMLDTEDKKDVIENIDTYSLDDIEAKLAVIAVRKKVNFNLNQDEQENKNSTFNINTIDDEDSVPAWIKAVKATAKSMNE